MPGQLRIIGGEWGGRRLSVGQAPGLRPTADRNRETLFNWLQGRLSGAKVLDLFAGTGALGLEALSRGAAQAVFVERSKPVAWALTERLRLLDGAERAQVNTQEAKRYLRGEPQAFDLIFLDPPFNAGLLSATLTTVIAGGWVHEMGLIYLEAGSHEASITLPAGWRIWREKRAGAVWFALIERDS
ncbi:MAG: 16S rRNA (guanine(966)-N(2))-methyltransferase RsmD [Spiribacter sp.]|jgi:16S rRNA (guanine966-N2)-methyltransferase|nr:16S rRNA (guanine(966)-N(2))-methyltransferase RsmD [Spiribacter sp.]MDR9488760.1 16S rRNA (guanine(966)-N(2))-methyltransferase RsmD [Spiribacter sp.]